jgi:hypothetical protein
MASSREKPGNSPVKTKDRPERQSIEAGVGGVLMGFGVGAGSMEMDSAAGSTRRVVANGGVSVTC